MSKEISDLIDEQRLIMAGDHPPEDKEATKRKYTPPSEDINHPGQMYNQTFPDHSKKDKPDRLKNIIIVKGSSSKTELPRDRGF